jgi:hypothetical protein
LITIKLPNQFLAALALLPLMLFGCSNSEESSDTSGQSDSGDRDCSEFSGEADIKECEMWNEMH